jgi:hypothetical protein
MKTAAQNQQLLTDQMREFVQDFRKLVTDEQRKTKEVMDDAVMKVLGDVAIAMENLEKVRRDAAKEESGRNEQLANQTNQLVGGLTTHVDDLLATVSSQVTKTQENIDKLGQVSMRAIDGMNQGAMTMGSAAQRFETAGSSVSGVLDRATQVTDKLTSASNNLQSAATAIQRGFEQYDATRKTVDTHVASLTGLIESARREAGVSKELVESIRTSAKSLRDAETESRAHLAKVNEVLKTAFNDFGTALLSQVQSTISATDRQLVSGAGQLTSVVQEIARAAHLMKRA